MTARFGFDRRRVLRGMLGGAAVTVGLPLLDCFLNANGTALASGAPMPVCFGNWVFGLGFNPGRWEPKIVGPNYAMAPELEVLSPFKDQINIYSGMKVFLDGKPNAAHQTGHLVCQGGGIPKGVDFYPSIDSLVADTIGTRTRFRSLEVSVDGSPQSYSRRGGSVVNPAETSPMALYTRVFGPEFKDPNAADFTPDPKVMVRRSVLSAVGDHREALLKQVGAADRARLDEYFTSLRSLEQQLDLQLEKPAPLEACSTPKQPEQGTVGVVVDDARANHRLFAQILAHALACGQTRVINVSGFSLSLRKPGEGSTYHIYTHEEAADPKLGYQPNVGWFALQVAAGFHDLLDAMNGIKEGGGTLLDRSLIYASTDCGFSKFHTVENMPLITVGKAGGRIKTGIHVQSQGDPVTRVGLTIQQALGVPANSWGTDSNQTSKTIKEVMA